MDQGYLSSRGSGWREKIFSHGRTTSNPRLYEGKGRWEARDSEEVGGKGEETDSQAFERGFEQGAAQEHSGRSDNSLQD